MIKFYFWVLFLLFMTSDLSSVVGKERINAIEKKRNIISLEWKTYNISSSETISLYGGKRREFINDNVYWGEAGYGALTGRRSGYLEGGLIFGWLGEYHSIFVADVRLFLGAAGGNGALDKQNGFFMNPALGLGVRINNVVTTCIEIGYISFIGGKIQSPTIAFNFNYNYWAVFCN
jgi:hypothetical protein